MIGLSLPALVLLLVISKGSATRQQQVSGHGTHFDGMGTPYGGCGVPPELAMDDTGKPLPYVALNTNTEFAYGANCGRWVNITLKENCVGAGNSQYSICNGGSFEADELTGTIIYGYTMDSCADDNFWCQDDTYHLDISRDYLTGMDMVGDKWNGRKVNWHYISSPPTGGLQRGSNAYRWKQEHPKFALKDGSKWYPGGTFWAATIIYNVANGIDTVEQKVEDTWEPLLPLDHLGNMYVLARPDNVDNESGGAGQTITFRVTDVDGFEYGQYEMEWSCGSEACSVWTDALSSIA